MKFFRTMLVVFAAAGFTTVANPGSSSARTLGVNAYQTISTGTRSVYFLSEVNSPCMLCWKQTYHFSAATAGIYTKPVPIPYLPIAVSTSAVRPKARADGINLTATINNQGGGSVGASTGGGACDAGQFSVTGSQVKVVMAGNWCTITGFNLWNGRISIVGYTLYGYTWYQITAS